jgi:nucleolar protein 58
MGTEILADDERHMKTLAKSVKEITEYRANLAEYLKNRMAAIAPNLTILVGELVAAKLIAHSGSLMNLAKQPASTI